MPGEGRQLGLDSLALCGRTEASCELRHSQVQGEHLWIYGTYIKCEHVREVGQRDDPVSPIRCRPDQHVWIRRERHGQERLTRRTERLSVHDSEVIRA